MNEVEKAYAKLSKNAREWWEDFEQASSSVAAMESAPSGEELDRRFVELPPNQRRYLTTLIRARAAQIEELAAGARRAQEEISAVEDEKTSAAEDLAALGSEGYVRRVGLPSTRQSASGAAWRSASRGSTMRCASSSKTSAAAPWAHAPITSASGPKRQPPGSAGPARRAAKPTGWASRRGGSGCSATRQPTVSRGCFTSFRPTRGTAATPRGLSTTNPVPPPLPRGRQRDESACSGH